MHNKQQTGATLIELIVSIVIISTALAGVLGIINLTVLYSADPIVQQQAIAIAESYIEEITALPVDDPDGGNAGETRATFDNVDDYSIINDIGVVDQNGNAVLALANYNVTVAIANQTIGSIPNQAINNVNNMRQITVTVQRPGVVNIRLVAYKAP